MNLVYHSTRNSEETATASEAILKGLTSDGGLFVPDSIPNLMYRWKIYTDVLSGNCLCSHERIPYRFYRRRIKDMH